MDEEELIKIIRDKKLSSKQLLEKLDTLKSQGIDCTYLMCKYILKYPDKYKKKKVPVSMVEFARWVVNDKEKSNTITNLYNGLEKMRKHLEDTDTP